MPAPPTPTMWIGVRLREVEVSGHRPPPPPGRRSARWRRAGPSVRAAALIAAQRSGSSSSACSSRSRRAASSVGVGDHDRGARRGERLGVGGLVVAGRAGQRHQHRGHADRGELGGHAARTRHHHRRLGVDDLHVLLERDESVRQRVARAPLRREPGSALFVVARARDMVDRDVGRGRASGRRGRGSPGSPTGHRGSRRPPRPAAGVTGARCTAAIAGRIGLPVTTAPGERGAGEADRRPGARGAPRCGWRARDGRRPRARRSGRRSSRAATSAGSDAYPPTPTTTRGRRRRTNRSARTTATTVSHTVRRFCASRAACTLRSSPRPGRRSMAKPAAGTAVASRPRCAPTKWSVVGRMTARDQLLGERERGEDVTAGAAAADQCVGRRSPSRGGRAGRARGRRTRPGAPR